MNRVQMIEKAAATMRAVDGNHRMGSAALAEHVVDALLPQVTTVEELEALPHKTLLVSQEGWPVWAWADGLAKNEIHNGRPLTVVWQP